MRTTKDTQETREGKKNVDESSGFLWKKRSLCLLMRRQLQFSFLASFCHFFTARHFCSVDRFFVAVTRCSVGRQDPSIFAHSHAHLTVPSESGRLQTINSIPEIKHIYPSRCSAACAGTAACCRIWCRCSKLQRSGQRSRRMQRWRDPLWHYLYPRSRLTRPKHTHTRQLEQSRCAVPALQLLFRSHLQVCFASRGAVSSSPRSSRWWGAARGEWRSPCFKSRVLGGAISNRQRAATAAPHIITHL